MLLGALCVILAAVVGFGQEKDAPAPDITAGRKLFESQCAVCHGATGTGGRGPSLNRPILNRAPDDEALRKLISEGFDPEMPGAWQLSPGEVANVAAFVCSLGSVPPEKVPGNPERGAALYRSNGCAACHIIAGGGNGFGPELTAIGIRRNAAHLRAALVRPAEFVPREFTSAEAVLSSGARIEGIRANEDSFTIQIKDTAGRFHSFRKSELKDVRLVREKSAMPAYTALQPADLDDLVSYLASLRGTK